MEGDASARNTRDFYARRMTWTVILGLFVTIVGRSMHIEQRFIVGGFSDKLSFRLFCLFFVAVLLLYVFLFLKSSHDGDIAQNMLDEWPVAAFTMSGTILVTALVSLCFFVDLLGIVGVLYCVSFWGCALNAMMLLPF